ncbi:hypothetical protein Tco_1227719 [Tanacetum coccineum]
MGDENPIRTVGDYSKPSHEGYMNTIELPIGNNMLAIGLNVFQQDPSPLRDQTPQRYPDIPTTSWRIFI